MKNAENTDFYTTLSVYIDNKVINRLLFNKRSCFSMEHYGLLFVREGRLSVDCESRKYSVLSGEGFLLRKEKTYEIKNELQDQAEYLEITFDGNGIYNMLRYLEIPEILHIKMSGNALEACIDRVTECFDSGQFFRASIELQNFFLTVKESERINYRESNLERIYSYIKKHYREPLDLTRLAAEYGTSISYFSRAFKQYYHVTPMNFVNEVRISYARILLETTDEKVNDIAMHCGYEKLEYFCYVFRKKEGCTPSQYRISRRYNRNYKNED